MPKATPTSPRRHSISRWLCVPGIGLLLGLALPTTTVSANGGSKTCSVNSMSFIHKRIDIGAQKSLMRKMSKDRKQQIEATSMLRAIEDGRLAGILLPPRKAAAERGARMSPPRGYWALIPTGQNSTCLKNPSGEAPMIVYRQKLSPAQIDAALTKAWRECGLPNVSKPCGYTVVKKPPKKTTPQECKDNANNQLSNEADKCWAEYPRGLKCSEVVGNCKADPKSSDCAKVPACVTEPELPKFLGCIDDAWNRYKAKEKLCDEK